MILRHATPRRNLPAILRRGLLTSKSRGRLPAVWLCAPSKTAWAMLHTVKRHGGRAEDVVVLEVRVPRRWLRRSKRGLWYCLRDIGPGRIGRVIDFAELARSPAEEPPAA
jgi:hypothetical protein